MSVADIISQIQGFALLPVWVTDLKLLGSDVGGLLFVTGLGTATGTPLWWFGSSIGIYWNLAVDRLPIPVAGLGVCTNRVSLCCNQTFTYMIDKYLNYLTI